MNPTHVNTGAAQASIVRNTATGTPRLEITISSPAARRCKSFEKFFFAVSTLTEGMRALLLLTIS
jgi:hypothetical protein